jgi:methyl-accepting chemotaxis protein
MNPAKTESQTVANTRTLSCTKENKGDYLSLGFLQSLVSSNEDISLRKTDRGTAILRMSKHVQNCMKLDFGFEKVGHDMLVMAKNVYDFKKEEVGVETVAELEDMTTEDKYVACLKNEGVLKTRDDGSYAFDRSAAKLADSQTTFNLDIQDKSKSMQLYFSSPKARDYATVYGDEGVPETTSKFPCLETERFAEPDPYLYVSDEDRLHYSANQACQTEDYETILSELSQLKSSSAGNAQELISVLKVALEDAREKRLSKIYDELEEIEDEFAPSRDDIAEGKLTGVTESRARSLGREYGELLSEVNELLYNPGIREVNDLMNELDEGVTPTREEEITQRISELNDEIGRFGKKDASNLGKVFDGLKEYGYTDEALKIEGFRLKSSNFSKVGPRGGNEKKISIEKADENIKKRLAEFERGTLRNWDDIHLAKSGSAEPIESLYQETQARTQRIQQMKQQFVQKEIAEDQKHCADNYVGGMRNPMECKRHREGRARRVQSFEGMMQQQSQQVQQQNARMAQLTQYYEEARRRNVAAEPQGGFYYDDPFGFYGSDSSSLYSLGGPQWNQQVMGLGMQGQYQMMGPVQGQYQNQGMMGQPPGTFNQGLQRPMWGY